MIKKIIYLILPVAFVSSCKKEHSAIVPCFTISPASVKSCETVLFTDCSTYDGSDAPSYTWDFGDGSSDAGKSVSHKYSRKGTYTITLSIKNGDAQADSSHTLQVFGQMGSCSFWHADPGPDITVNLATGVSEHITASYPAGVTDCTLPGCANFISIAEGTYAYSAIQDAAPFKTWSGEITISCNDCITKQLIP